MSNALGVTYGVGLDGSRMSYQALDIVLSLARKSDGNDATRCDKVVCIHVPSEQNQGTDVIKGEADARCTKLGPDMFNWKVERKQPGDTTTKVSAKTRVNTLIIIVELRACAHVYARSAQPP